MTSQNWVALFLLCSLLGIGCAVSSPLVGNAAPEFRLRDQDNESRQLSDYQGKKGLVLVFYYAST